MNVANRELHCTNCGLNGHIFRTCNAPITSYGVIAVRYNNAIRQSVYSKSTPINDSIECILIQRKDSLSFIEFIRGKYSQYNDTYISKLLRGMTQNEQSRISTSSFNDLWNDIWGKASVIRSHKNDYDASEKRFLQIVHKLPQLIMENPTVWTEPEWGFPKGRRNPYESDYSCAIREFLEETGLNRNNLSILQNITTISEVFTGSNNVNYCHKYYVAICNNSVEVEMNTNNIHMTREIGAIKWCTVDEALSKIRSDNIEKREVLLKINRMLTIFHPIHITELFKSQSY